MAHSSDESEINTIESDTQVQPSTSSNPPYKYKDADCDSIRSSKLLWRSVYDTDVYCSDADLKRGGRYRPHNLRYNARLDRSLSDMIISGDIINDSVKKRQTAYSPSLVPKAKSATSHPVTSQRRTQDGEEEQEKYEYYDDEELKESDTTGLSSRDSGHKKLRLRDLYRELRLMRQLMAACTGPEAEDQCEFQEDDRQELTEEEEAERLRENQELLRSITSDIVLGRTKECGLEDDELFQESDDEETDDLRVKGTEKAMTKEHVLYTTNSRGHRIIGCVVMTTEDLDISDLYDCSIEEPASVPPIVDIYEILLSNFVSIYYKEGQARELSTEIIVGIPYLKTEKQYFQEVFLRYLNEYGNWVDTYFTKGAYTKKDNSLLPLLLTKIRRVSTFAVVCRPVKDRIVFTEDFTSVTSSVEKEIVIQCPKSSRINSDHVHVDLRVLPVMHDNLVDVKQTFDSEDHVLYDAGSFITLDFLSEQTQPVHIEVPIHKPSHVSRPVTGAGTPDSGYRSGSRPSNKLAEKESYLVRFADCLPTHVHKITDKDIHGDNVVFSVHEKSSTSIILDATRDIRNERLEDAIQKMIYSIEYQRVQICFAHSRLNRSELAMSCDKRSKIDLAKMSRLESENDVTKMNVSLREGSTICMCSRGNISSIPNAQKIFRFYGVHGIHTAWTLDVLDKYSQRSLEAFCGHLQMYVWIDATPFSNQDLDVQDSKWKLLLEIPVTLPKSHAGSVAHRLHRAPVIIREDNPVSQEMLDGLARCIGDEWKELAHALSLADPRVQSIKQQHRGHHVHLVREVLVSWFKTCQVSKDKGLDLIQALRDCGRVDLAERIQETHKSYRRGRLRLARAHILAIVIAAISRSRKVNPDWRSFGFRLGVDQSALDRIDKTYETSEEKCREMLIIWKDTNHINAINILMGHLRTMGCHHVADHVVALLEKKH